MTITRNLKLYLNAGTASAPYINVNQYDEGEEWVFTLYNEDGSTYTPSSGAIIGIKSDGNAIMNAGSVVGGKVVITETEQMTAASGRAIFELLIDNATHGTANFIVNVERRPSDDAEFSDSDLSMLQEAIDAAEVINEILDEGGDPSEIIAENVDAWLDNHPEATTTVQDGAITAPKINNSLWDKLLVSESASGAVASFADGADDVPVSSLKVALEPIQAGSGDPSPSNVRPIYPVNGKNLFDMSLMSRINANTFRTSDFPLNAGTYTFSRPSADNGLYNWYVRKRVDSSFENLITGGSNIANGTFTISESITCYVEFYSSTGIADNVIKNIMLETGSVPSAYQPYQGIMVERAGKNLLPAYSNQSESINGITLNNNSGEYVFNGTATARASFDIPFSLNAGTYTVAFNNAVATALGAFSIYLMRGGSIIENLSSRDANAVFQITLTQSIDNCRLTIAGAITLNNYAVSPIITYQTDSTFEPFVSPVSYPISLGREVYGGTVDLATGVLTVTHGIVDLGSLTWAIQQTNTSGKNRYRGYISPNPLDSDTGTAPSWCTAYKLLAAGATFACVDGFTITSNNVYVYDSTKDTMTGAEFKTAVSGYMLVYPLATPQTIQLTPQEVKTLLGYNNISSSGTVDVIYHADTKLYVDKMTAVDNAIIAPTEEGFTATRNYTVNDLVIVNDTLYKVTSNIATGSAITPNSNVQQTTLGALIKALS